MKEKTKSPGAGPVLVAREVYDGIEAVRVSGLTNMLARDVVAGLAEDLGFEESACWIRENPCLYSRAVFQGLTVIGTSSDQEVSE